MGCALHYKLVVATDYTSDGDAWPGCYGILDVQEGCIAWWSEGPEELEYVQGWLARLRNAEALQQELYWSNAEEGTYAVHPG